MSWKPTDITSISGRFSGREASQSFFSGYIRFVSWSKSLVWIKMDISTTGQRSNPQPKSKYFSNSMSMSQGRIWSLTTESRIGTLYSTGTAIWSCYEDRMSGDGSLYLSVKRTRCDPTPGRSLTRGIPCSLRCSAGPNPLNGLSTGNIHIPVSETHSLQYASYTC